MSTTAKVLFIMLYILSAYSLYEQHRISKTFDGAIAAMAESQPDAEGVVVVEDTQ